MFTIARLWLLYCSSNVVGNGFLRAFFLRGGRKSHEFAFRIINIWLRKFNFRDALCAFRKSSKRYKKLFVASKFFRERYKFRPEKPNKKGIPLRVSLYSAQRYNIRQRNANYFNIRKHLQRSQSEQEGETVPSNVVWRPLNAPAVSPKRCAKRVGAVRIFAAWDKNRIFAPIRFKKTRRCNKCHLSLRT